jgi:hypothetical protein
MLKYFSPLGASFTSAGPPARSADLLQLARQLACYHPPTITSHHQAPWPSISSIGTLLLGSPELDRALNEIKGTVSRDFLWLVFFIKQLLLVPIGMPRNDFEFF